MIDKLTEQLAEALRFCERYGCPCGARPESLNTHPHVISCKIGEALAAIDAATKDQP